MLMLLMEQIWYVIQIETNIQFLVQGGFSTVYKGIWLNGPISHWDYEKKDWKRRNVELNECRYEDAKIKNPLKVVKNMATQLQLKA